MAPVETILWNSSEAKQHQARIIGFDGFTYQAIIFKCGSNSYAVNALITSSPRGGFKPSKLNEN